MKRVRFRPCRGAADYPALAELANRLTPEEFGLAYGADTFADLFERSLIAYDVSSAILAEADDRLVGSG